MTRTIHIPDVGDLKIEVLDEMDGEMTPAIENLRKSFYETIERNIFNAPDPNTEKAKVFLTQMKTIAVRKN